MNTDIKKGADCYCITVNGKLAGFIGIIIFPHPIQTYRKVHRLVILPDYQGIGLGRILLNTVAKYIKDYPYAITTSNPALIQSLKNDNVWICTRNTRNRRNKGKLAKVLNKTLSNKRIVTTFVYKG